MDKIVAKGMRFNACHGVAPEEKQNPQPFIVDLELSLDLEKAGRSDYLEDTVDYGAVFKCVQDIVEGPSFNLLEALARAIADRLLADFEIEAVKVRVKKPEAPVEGDFEYFSVIIERFQQ
ncbi:MAG: dihydroneopterin aldolase [Syntrophomonadaceae bacterium]